MYQHKKKGQTAQTKPLSATKTPKLTPEQQAAQRANAEFLAIQRQKKTWMAGFKQTVTPQRDALTPVLTAGKFRTEHEQAIQRQKQAAQTELTLTQAALPAPEVIQRIQASAETQPALPVQRTRDGRLFIPTMQAATQHFNEQVSIQRKKSMDGSLPLAHWQQAARQTTSALVGLYQTSQAPAAERQQELASSLAGIDNEHDRSRLASVTLSQLKPASDGPIIQRMLDERIAEEAQKHSVLSNLATVQRLQAQLSDLEQEASIQDGPALTKRIEDRRGQGFTLPVAVQRQLEEGLNTDLSGVRIHADQAADKLSKSVGAIAFTTGTDIFFQSNKYDPYSTAGFKLLAHETTHVKQQMEGRATPGIDSDAGLEAEAQRAETKLSTLKPASKKVPSQTAAKPAAQTAKTTGALQRQIMPTIATTATPAVKFGQDVSLGGAGQKWQDAQSATSQALTALPGRVAAQYQALPDLLKQGILQMLKDAAITLGATTAIGAIIGAFFGGIGAAPGAKIGFEVGLSVLKLWGLYEVVKLVTSQLGALGTQLASFVKQINAANGNPTKINAAANTLTNAFLILTNAVVAGVAAYALKRGMPALANSRFGKAIGAKTEKSASVQWLMARHRGAVAREQRTVQAGQRIISPRIKAFDAALQQIRPHIIDNDYVARGKSSAPIPSGQTQSGISTTTNTFIRSDSLVILEPVPGNAAGFTVSRINVFDSSGTSAGRINSVATGIPINTNFSFELVGNGRSVRWTPGQTPPNGFRYKLKDRDVRQRGLAGGHTRDAFNESLNKYHDKIAVTGTDVVRFRFPGNAEAVELSKISYNWGGSPVTASKTIFEGSGTAHVQAFERALAQSLDDYFKKGGTIRNKITVKIPVIGKNSKTTQIEAEIWLSRPLPVNPASISIETWYVSQSAFSNPVIKK